MGSHPGPSRIDKEAAWDTPFRPDARRQANASGNSSLEADIRRMRRAANTGPTRNGSAVRRQDHGVDDVNDTVRCRNVGLYHLGVVDHDGAAFGFNIEHLAVCGLRL